MSKENDEPTTALVKPVRAGVLKIAEQTLKPDKVIAAAIASGYFKSLKSEADGWIIAAYGASLNMDLTTALSSIILINGRMTFTANFVAAMVKKSTKYNYKVVSKTDKKAEIEFWEKVEHCTKEGVRYWEWEKLGVETFTVEMAKRAQLTTKGPNWAAYPEAMCFARAMTAGVRTYCPDLLSGQSCYTPDELDPSLKMAMNAEGDLVPDADYTVAQPTPPPPAPPKPDRIGEIRELMKSTNTDEKQFLIDLCQQPDIGRISPADQDKVVRTLKSKLAAAPF